MHSIEDYNITKLGRKELAAFVEVTNPATLYVVPKGILISSLRDLESHEWRGSRFKMSLRKVLHRDLLYLIPHAEKNLLTSIPPICQSSESPRTRTEREASRNREDPVSTERTGHVRLAGSSNSPVAERSSVYDREHIRRVRVEETTSVTTLNCVVRHVRIAGTSESFVTHGSSVYDRGKIRSVREKEMKSVMNEVGSLATPLERKPRGRSPTARGTASTSHSPEHCGNHPPRTTERGDINRGLFEEEEIEEDNRQPQHLLELATPRRNSPNDVDREFATILKVPLARPSAMKQMIIKPGPRTSVPQITKSSIQVTASVPELVDSTSPDWYERKPAQQPGTRRHSLLAFLSDYRDAILEHRGYAKALVKELENFPDLVISEKIMPGLLANFNKLCTEIDSFRKMLEVQYIDLRRAWWVNVWAEVYKLKELTDNTYSLLSGSEDTDICEANCSKYKAGEICACRIEHNLANLAANVNQRCLPLLKRFEQLQAEAKTPRRQSETGTPSSLSSQEEYIAL